MKHLFIINPIAGGLRGQANRIVGEIRAFFNSHPRMSADIHITRWKRDAMGFTRRYVTNSDELVRVYAIGGTGTFFEVINGVIGVPNTQVALCPMGAKNSFLQYYGDDALYFFRSFRNLIFSGTISLDAVRWGNTYGVNNCLIGVEALSYFRGGEVITKTHLPDDLCYKGYGAYCLLTGRAVQRYRIELDGEQIEDDYVSIMIANSPCYGKHMYPAIDASPYDGKLNVYLLKPMPKSKIIPVISDYEHGRYRKWPGFVSHHETKTLSISSDRVMPICFDGEMFFDSRVDFGIIHRGVDMVCPAEVNPNRRGLPGNIRTAAANTAKTGTGERA
ncbi:MAG: hypothetical protein LBQ38_11745 [Spirochaetaceae bacterium]|jgi:diacylglycerol kinase family enzyme|nr:hypothetical protein [Spirochaetaceae bacterium]